MTKPQFVYVTYIATTPEKLWEALTDGNFSQKYWMGARVESQWEIGSPVTYTSEAGVDFHGEVLRVEPYKVLSYTFIDVCGGFNEPASRVTFEMEPVGPLLKLTTTHDNFESGSKLLEGISNGWPAILAGLKTVLETGNSITGDRGIFGCGKPKTTV